MVAKWTQMQAGRQARLKVNKETLFKIKSQHCGKKQNGTFGKVGGEHEPELLSFTIIYLINDLFIFVHKFIYLYLFFCNYLLHIVVLFSYTFL